MGPMITYRQDGHTVDALGLVVGLRHQISVDILEVGDGHILFEFFVEDHWIFLQLDFACGVGCLKGFWNLGVDIDHSRDYYYTILKSPIF